MKISVKSNWTGSENTSNLVRREIAKRWGEDEAKRYNPFDNCLTFKGWLKNGCVVRKDEKAIRSFIVVEKKDKKTGEVIERRLKTIYLFYDLQVEAKAWQLKELIPDGIGSFFCIDNEKNYFLTVNSLCFKNSSSLKIPL